MRYFEFFTHKKLPLWEIVKMSSVCSFGIVFMNLNLNSNSLGVYQVNIFQILPFFFFCSIPFSARNSSNFLFFFSTQLSKLLLIPTIAVIQYYMFQKTLSIPVMGSLATMILGVGLATIDSLKTNFIGAFWAALSILTQSMCQIVLLLLF